MQLGDDWLRCLGRRNKSQPQGQFQVGHSGLLGDRYFGQQGSGLRVGHDQGELEDAAAELEAAGYFIAVATGKSRGGLDRALAQNALTGRFHATRCADEGRPKPHPDMLLHLIDFVGVTAGETLMIGDTTHDLDLARNAGAQGLAVAYGAHDPAGLEERRPLATVHSVAELGHWLARHG